MKNIFNNLMRRLFNTEKSRDVGDIHKSRGQHVKATGPTCDMSRQCPTFSGIELHGAIDLKVVVSKTDGQSVVLRAPIIVQDLVVTEVHGRTLVVTSTGSFSTNNPVELHVTVKELSALSINGASDVFVEGLREEALTIHVEGAAAVRAAGDVNALTVRVAGAGSVDLEKLISKKMSALVSGAAHIQAHATHEVTLDVSGAASVVVKGNPLKKTATQSGASDVIFV